MFLRRINTTPLKHKKKLWQNMFMKQDSYQKYEKYVVS